MRLEFALEMRIELGPRVHIPVAADYTRGAVLIEAGSFCGPGLSGRVVRGSGGDFPLVQSDGSGRFRGEGLTGSVVAGGETLLQRADGVVVVEANYYIRFADGAVARCFGRGYRTMSGEFTGLRLSLLFEAAGDGSVAMLTTRVYVAEQPEAGAVLTISRIT